MKINNVADETSFVAFILPVACFHAALPVRLMETLMKLTQNGIHHTGPECNCCKTNYQCAASRSGALPLTTTAFVMPLQVELHGRPC